MSVTANRTEAAICRNPDLSVAVVSGRSESTNCFRQPLEKSPRQSPSRFNASGRGRRNAVGIDAQMPKNHVCGMLLAKIKPFVRHQIGLQKNGQRVLIGYVI